MHNVWFFPLTFGTKKGRRKKTDVDGDSKLFIGFARFVKVCVCVFVTQKTFQIRYISGYQTNESGLNVLAFSFLHILFRFCLFQY